MKSVPHGLSRARIVTIMLEARFDDLTGASPSFRMVEPVGVLEGRAAVRSPHPGGCRGALARGLWVRGFVSYEAALASISPHGARP